jgi:hypothetical protein
MLLSDTSLPSVVGPAAKNSAENRTVRASPARS